MKMISYCSLVLGMESWCPQGAIIFLYLGRCSRKKVTVVQMRMKARLHSLAWALLPVLWRLERNTFLLSSAE